MGMYLNCVAGMKLIPALGKMEKVDHILEFQHLGEVRISEGQVILGYIAGLRLVIATRQAAICSPDRDLLKYIVVPTGLEHTIILTQPDK